MEDHKFKEQVINDLAVLKTNMEDLLTKPFGRIPILEKRVLMLTIGLAVLALTVFGPSAVAWVLH